MSAFRRECRMRRWLQGFGMVPGFAASLKSAGAAQLSEISATGGGAVGKGVGASLGSSYLSVQTVAWSPQHEVKIESMTTPSITPSSYPLPLPLPLLP